MIFIELTSNNGNRVVLNPEKISEMYTRGDGGTTIYLDSAGDDGEGQAIIIVKEVIDVILGRIKAGGV
jgi:uncharacterized protein YlzI (FlbEa/FlbD family)